MFAHSDVCALSGWVLTILVVRVRQLATRVRVLAVLSLSCADLGSRVANPSAVQGVPDGVPGGGPQRGSVLAVTDRQTD